MIRIRTGSLAVVLAALLAACGGNDDTPVEVTSVKVMGDSLSDVGTFGLKFTVQGSNSQVFPERIAQAYGLPRGCNFFAFTGATFVANPTAGCTNYAVGGGVINGAAAGLAAADPRNLSVQLATATAAGNYAAGDLVVIGAGGNDAANLVGAYLRAGQPAPAGDGGASYLSLLGTQLTQAQVGAAAAGGAAGLAGAGGQYMTALANSLHAMIQTQVLDKGAQRVVVVNMPGITDTPRFQTVLDGIAAATGGGATGAAARAQSETLFKGWVQAFNAQLATRFQGSKAVVLVDGATLFTNMVASPAQFGLSNVKLPACPITGVGSDGLPAYTFPTCTEAALSSAAPPAGGTGGADWWRTHLFSDGFHPTPYGHQLLAELIARSLAAAGWI